MTILVISVKKIIIVVDDIDASYDAYVVKNNVVVV